MCIGGGAAELIGGSAPGADKGHRHEYWTTTLKQYGGQSHVSRAYQPACRAQSISACSGWRPVVRFQDSADHRARKDDVLLQRGHLPLHGSRV